MRVLFVAPSLPWPLDAGGRIRTYKLIEALDPDVHVDLWVVGAEGPEPAPALVEARARVAGIVRELRVFERSPLPQIRRLAAPKQEGWFHSAALERALASVRAQDHDLIHLDELCLLRALPDALNLPLLVHHHKLDLELALGLANHRVQANVETIRWRRLEALAVKQSSRHAFCCTADSDRFLNRQKISGHRIEVIENGVDPQFFAPRPGPRDDDHLLVLGSLDYRPNRDGLRSFLAGPWAALRARRPRLRLSVVGSGDESLAPPELPAGVHWIGEVPDVRPWLARASALVVPLSLGGGTRLKIAEAAAMGCPVLSTRVGAEGLPLQSPEHFLEAASIDELSLVIDRALDDPEAMARRAERARRRTLERLSWKDLSRRLEAAWKRCHREVHPQGSASDVHALV